jgi:crotonobetainyl-CoA:carnitine CoA-transferase CaiB-like acyl-CoA transferase
MPLRGLQVVELAGLAPGPLCGKFLHDFGATVIVVHKVSVSVYAITSCFVVVMERFSRKRA